MFVIRVAVLAVLVSASAQVWADQDFYGVVTQRPEGKVGTWVVASKTVAVDATVRIKEEHGPAKVGACVKLDYETRNGMRYLEEIETERPEKCQKK